MKTYITEFLYNIHLDDYFWISALLGTGIFLVQLVLNLLTGSLETDFDALDNQSFSWLSKQILSGFFMMFGWVGLTCDIQFGLSPLDSLTIAFLAGVITIFITSFLFKIAKGLQSTGTVFRIEDTIGKEAEVYQQIPSHGTGVITLLVDSITYEIDARSIDQTDIPSFTKVKILQIADEKTVFVKPLT